MINAGAAPGSYLGMDPAQLIWVPPLEVITDLRDEDDKTPEPMQEPDETEPLYEEIKMPRYGHYLSARSNTESSANTNSNTTPSSDELSPLSSELHSKASSPTAEMNLKNTLLQQNISTSAGIKQPTPYFSRKQRRHAKQQSRSTSSLRSGARDVVIQMQQLCSTKSARNIRKSPTASVEAEDVMSAHATPRGSPEIPAVLVNSITDSMTESMTGSYVEKETLVEKQTSPELSEGLLGLDDIQFADESESDHDVSKQKCSKYEQVKPKTVSSIKARMQHSSTVAAKLKRVSADSAILEKRGLVKEPSSYRIETNVWVISNWNYFVVALERARAELTMIWG